MATAKLYSKDGTVQSEVQLPPELFGQEVDLGAIHEAVTIYLGNQRQGNSKTKGRSEVSGGGKKPWKQKGTGRARQGSNTAPNWARGGKAHGPLPRSYDRKLNKKFKQLAFASALSLKASQSQVHIFEEIDVAAPKTKQLVALLKKANLDQQKNTILTSDIRPQLGLAARNLPNTQVQRVQDLNTYEVMAPQNLIFTQSALVALAARGGQS